MPAAAAAAIPKVPSRQDSQRAAKNLLKKKYCRLTLSLGLLFCLMVTVGMIYLLYAFLELFWGRQMELWSDIIYFLAMEGLMVAGIFLSLPLYHGYMICAADIVRTDDVNLGNLFQPFSGARQFFGALLFSALYMLPFFGSFCVYVCGAIWKSIPVVLLSNLLFPLFYWLGKLPRRICRLHACFPERGWRSAYRTAIRSPKQLNRAHSNLGWATVPFVLLTLVTLGIYGVYDAVARYALTSSHLYLQYFDDIAPRKDRES